MAPLYVSATTQEAAHIPSDRQLLITGIGGVAAATALSSYLADAAARNALPERIINLGTAGSLTTTDGIFEISSVFKHDFDTELLEAVTGMKFSRDFTLATTGRYPTAVLATGDSFISDDATRSALAQKADLCDMEGYSVAYVADRFGVPCTLLKQVSDQADDAAIRTWVQSVARGAPALAEAALTL